MSLIKITHLEPTVSNRARVAYINCADILEVAENYDKDGRLISTNSKLLLRSGKTYVVNESLTALTLRISQECPAAANIAGPAGPPGIQGEQGPPGIQGEPGSQGNPGTSGSGYLLNGSVTTANTSAESLLIGTIYLQAGTISNTSTAYISVERELIQVPDNNTAVYGAVYITTLDNSSMPVFLRLGTDESVNSGLSIEGSTTYFSGDGVIDSAGWHRVYVSAVGSENPSSKLINGCTASTLGLNLIYQ